MKKMTSSEIRTLWLSYFESHGHEIISSSSLIPVNDPTLLWINAGVAPLKKFFDGREIPNNPRMTNIQKCVRTNDIENVGKTARHHTFFEMMGNFSIGNYFKKEAIKLAYDLLFLPNNFNFPFEKIYITHYPTDLETREFWLELGINENHLIASYENFWEIGAGPSGPSTEIFFDRGEKYDKRGVELIKEDLENDRYVELWNVVFSQFDANPNVSRDEYKELPNRNIDTGAGLERFACIMQNVETNFETDLFMPIIEKVAEISGVKYDGQMAFKVIADHIKAVTIALSDGAIFSNEGRGYVLRRLLRRALKHGRTLNLTQPFLNLLVPVISSIYGSYYPNIISMEEIIIKIVKIEEEKFIHTITDGEKLLIDYINENKQVSGDIAFKLYDTYGYPIELTLEYAEEHSIVVDVDEFNNLLLKQKELSRQNRNVLQSMGSQNDDYLQFREKSTFKGYELLNLESEVIKVFPEGIVVKETPFYATKGGQVCDTGLIDNILVKEVIQLPNGQHLHILDEHNFNEGDVVSLKVDFSNREKIIKNHTATHLLHQALKDVIGSHTNQQGSLVNEKVLRFDFNHYENVTVDQVLEVEKIVNDKIKESLEVTTDLMLYDDAIKKGAMALFGEKYEKEVRVVNISNYSIELCGGIHVNNTKQINNFVISSIESIGSGIYRITAITNVINSNQMKVQLKPYIDTINLLEDKLINELKFTNDKLLKWPNITNSYNDIITYRMFVKDLQELVKNSEKELLLLEEKKVLSEVNSLIPVPYLEKMVITVNDLPVNLLKQVIDQMFDKINGKTVVLFNIAEDKVTYLCKTVDGNANIVIKKINELLGGRGGGKDSFAQGATTDFDSFYNNLPFFEELL